MKKKVLLIAVAMILVCALSIAGTVAFLTKTATPVTNTFVASATPSNFVDDLTLNEYNIEADGNGGYNKLTTTNTSGNNYTIVPGVELPKHAFVHLARTNTTPAFLFIEVVNPLDEDVFTYSIDSRWVKLDGVTGPQGGAVYVLGTKSSETVTGTVLNAMNANYDILTDNIVTVKDNATPAASVSMSFYAYVTQATVVSAGNNTTDPATVFNACFKPST